MYDFDVLVRIDLGYLGCHVSESAACSAMRRAVLRLPGIGSARVECSAVLPNEDAVRVSLSLPSGTEPSPAAEEWARLRVRVTAVVLMAMDDEEPDGPSLPVAPPSAGVVATFGGFADAQGFQLDARTQSSGKRPGSLPARPDEVPAMPPATEPEEHVLLARLLRLVNPHADSEPLARTAVRRFGSFAAVLAAPARDLRVVPGLGTHSISAIKLVHEAALRLARAGVMHRPVLDDWQRLLDYLSAQLGREKIEQFRVLFLDDRDRLLADEAQARGTVNHTPVYPREVVRRALELQAAAVILVHNHPSGDPTPSRDDLAMTAQVAEAAAVLSIALRDHVIVGNGRWVSFRQEGLL